MEISRILVIVFMSAIVLMAFGQAQVQFVVPAPSPPSDGSSIDQGIAYVLMLLALLCYLRISSIPWKGKGLNVMMVVASI